MDLGDPGKGCWRPRSAVRIALIVALPILVVLTGCTHDSGSRIHVELRDTPQSKPAAQTAAPKDYPCPETNLGDTNGHLVSPEGHNVKLSWNPSTSSTGPNDVNILYCLYRTKGGAVQKDTTSPCSDCQRVTKFAVQGTTTDPDGDVEIGSRYCYVAVAVDVRNKKVSGFSNPAPALIPPASGPFSCDPQTTDKQGDSKNHRGRH